MHQIEFKHTTPVESSAEDGELMTLLDDRYAPITSEIGFIECESCVAKEAYLAWAIPIQAQRGVRLETQEVSGDFVSKISNLLPLTSIERRRALFLPTIGRWTAYIDNGWQGTDSFSVMSYLSQKIACQAIRAVAIPDTITRTPTGSQGRYGATIFELYAPNSESCSFLNIKRSVFAANDGGRWKFAASGDVLDFENIQQYTSRRIQDRFNSEILENYLRHFGIDLFTPEFYGGTKPAYLVSKVGSCADGLKEYTLAEARSDF